MPDNARPNILIVQNDQFGGAALDPGHPCRTPNADRLAAEGVRFSQTYTIAAHCCPSRASFMSGLYPSRHGIRNNVLNATAQATSLRPGTRLFSEALQEAGYRLAFAGKWHVCADERPRDRGWQESDLVTSVAPEHHGRTWAQWRAYAERLDDSAPRGRGEILRPGWGRYRLYGTAADDPVSAPLPRGDWNIVQAGIRALQGLTADQSSPWCCYIGPNGPHDPYIIPEHYATMYDPADVALPPNYRDDFADKPRVLQRLRRERWSQLTDDEVREAIAHYWGYCTLQDDLLGLVLEALDRTGQAANTLVLYCSDHGDYAGAHGLFAKGVAAYEEAYRIPCVMRWPNGIARAGRTEDCFVSMVDFAPTFAELAGAELPDVHGRSLLPWLQGMCPDDWPDAIHTQFDGVELYYTQRMLRTRGWQLTYNGFDEDELYDLRADPHCLHNLALDPAYAPVMRELYARMWAQAERTTDYACNDYIPVSFAPWGPMEGLRTP
ncbi:MAG: sulfatase-like hydrolase/transferase [Chloroflexi bacterium]|nr:sulfatase-like hydrolase/transferase [Chloroflexota bacterium]